jgi:hypothetical protein
VHKVYLAGPISGLTYDGAQQWREYAKGILAPEIHAYTPLRAKQYLRTEGVLQQSYDVHPLSTDRGINTRDHFDCMTSDLILCYLLGATERSTGTIMEVAWSFAYKKPLVVVMEKEGNCHDHPMLREAIGYRTEDLDQALNIVRAILLP